MKFWLYDIEYDNNPFLERKVYSYFFRGIYVIMLTYTIIYAILG